MSASERDLQPVELTLPEYIETFGDKLGVPKSLRDAIFTNETNTQHTKNGKIQVSPKGARGVGQLMPGTARMLGVKNIDDPIENAHGALRLQKQLYDKYLRTQGDEHEAALLAAAAYNAGEGAIDKHNGIPPYKETQDYVWKVAQHLKKNPIKAPQTALPAPPALHHAPAVAPPVKRTTKAPILPEPGFRGDFGTKTPSVLPKVTVPAERTDEFAPAGPEIYAAQQKPSQIDSVLIAAVQHMQEKNAEAKRKAVLQGKVEQVRARMAGEKLRKPPSLFGTSGADTETVRKAIGSMPFESRGPFKRVSPEQQAIIRQAVDTPQQPSMPAMQARQPGIIERVKGAIAPYTPGLESLDTPGGIKTDPVRGVVRGVTLGALGDKREITPEELLLNPRAETDRDVAEFAGETAGAVVPYVGVGKLIGKIPALARAGRTAAAARTGATFWTVETGRQAIHSAKTGTPIDSKEIAVSTAIGWAMGAIPGINPSMKQRLFAAVAPQVVADVARGRTPEEAAQAAITNLLFEAAAGRRLGVSAKRIGELRAQIDASRTVPSETQRSLRNAEQVKSEASQPAASDSAVAPEVPPITEEIPTVVEEARRRKAEREKVSAGEPVEVPVTPTNVPPVEAAQPASAKTTASLPVERRSPQRKPDAEWLELTPEEQARTRASLEMEMGPPTRKNGVPIQPEAPYAVSYKQGDLGSERAVEVRDGSGKLIGSRDPFWPQGIPSTKSAQDAAIKRTAKAIIDEQKPATPPKPIEAKAEYWKLNDAERKEWLTPDGLPKRDAPDEIRNKWTVERNDQRIAEAEQRIESSKAARDDWASRQYKSNQQGIVKKDQFGEDVGMQTISAANERRRRRTIQSLDQAIRENEELLPKLRRERESAFKNILKPQTPEQAAEAEAMMKELFPESPAAPKPTEPAGREVIQSKVPERQKQGGLPDDVKQSSQLKIETNLAETPALSKGEGAGKLAPKPKRETIPLEKLTRTELKQRVRQGGARADEYKAELDRRYATRTLQQFFRDQGGFVPSEDLAGEARRLSPKETSTTGLINKNARTGDQKMSAEYMMDAANVEGYRDINGEPFTSIGDFLMAAESDSTGRRRQYTKLTDGDEVNWAKELETHELKQQHEHDIDATHSLLENDGTGRLYDRIVEGKATAEELAEFKRAADENFGISREAVDALITRGYDAAQAEADSVSRSVSTLARAEQLGFVEEGLTQESAPPPKLPDQKSRLAQEEAARHLAAVKQTIPAEGMAERLRALTESSDAAIRSSAQETWERARTGQGARPTEPLYTSKIKLLETLADLKAKGMTVDDYANQGSLIGETPTPEKIALLRELEGSRPKQVPVSRAETEAEIKRLQGEMRKFEMGVKDSRLRDADVAHAEYTKNANRVVELSDQLEGRPQPAQPSFVTSAIERQAERAAQKAEGIEFRRAGADPYELVDNIIVRGWELYSEKVKPTFEEWSKKIREEFGPESDSHLQKVWLQLGGERETTTSARKAQMASDRAELDLPELPPAERKSWQDTLNEAKERGTKNASVLADEVLSKPRSLNEVETGQLVLRAQEVKNDLAKVRKEIVDERDSRARLQKIAESEALQGEFNKLSAATKASGSEKGRTLAAQKLTINQDYDLTSVIQRATEKRDGRDLTPAEKAKFEQQTTRIAELEAKLVEAQKEAEGKAIQKDIARIRRQINRGETKKVLDDEFAALRTQFAQARAEIRGVQPSGLASLDPEGKLTPILLKMARNRVKAGTVKVEEVVDQIHDAIKDSVDVSKDEIRSLLSGHNLEHDPLPAIKTRLGKQEAELTRKLEQKDYSPAPPKKKPIYDKEASDLKARVEGLKRRLDDEVRGTDTKLETAIAMWKAGLLTGLKTHARNVGGTAAFQGFEEVSRIPGSVADLIVSSVTKRRALTGPDPVAVAKSSYVAATKGIHEAKQIMKYGATSRDLQITERHRELNSGSKIIDTYVNTIFRSMGAEDKVFRTYAYERSMLEQAKLRGRDAAERKHLEEVPTADMVAQGILDAEVSTFNNQNAAATGLEWVRQHSGPVGKTAIDLIVPFRRTPTNIMARLLESTPLGLVKGASQLVRGAVKKEFDFEAQRKFSQTIGRSVTGSSLIALGAFLASKGLASGLYEEDRGDREVQEAAGRSPMAVRIGDAWHQVGAFSPLGNLLAVGAALYREKNRPPKEGEESPNLVAAALPVAAKTMLEQPMLKGVSGVVDAVKEPGSRGSSVVGRTLGSFVPTIVSDVGAAIDNKRRETRGIGSKVQTRVPFLRSGLPEDVDVFGRPLESRRSAMFDPTLTSSAKDDPFIKELIRLDIGVVKTNRKPGESETAYRERMITQGKEIATRLAKVTASQNYKNKLDEDKREVIKDTIESVRREVNKSKRFKLSEKARRMVVDRMRVQR